MKEPVKVIINADDLGAETQVNDAIFAFMQQGKITSASILANGEAVDDAINKAHFFPGGSFGVHLNLTQFRPMTDSEGLMPLLNADGSFNKRAIRSVPMTDKLRKAIMVELTAQVQFLIAQGVPISHIDSHHHIHTIPVLFGVLKKLQGRFGITKVRCSMNFYQDQQSKLTMFQKALWNYTLRHYHKTTTTELFTTFAVFHNKGGSLIRVPKTVELMTHPGALNNAEETALVNRGLKDACPFQMKLINYNQL